MFGLVNVGNTCYMNVGFQLLLTASPLNDQLQRELDALKTTGTGVLLSPEGHVLWNWVQLCEMWKKHRVLREEQQAIVSEMASIGGGEEGGGGGEELTMSQKYKTLYGRWMAIEDQLSRDVVVNPHQLVQSIRAAAGKYKKEDLATPGETGDLVDVMLFILECCHQVLKRPVRMSTSHKIHHPLEEEYFKEVTSRYEKEYSSVWHMCYGTHLSHLYSRAQDDNNNNTAWREYSHRFEPFDALHLSLEQVVRDRPSPSSCSEIPVSSESRRISLEECLSSYYGEVGEMVDSVWNETTQRKEAMHKKTYFWTMPTVLIIHIQRMVDIHTLNKTVVTFPVSEMLDMSPYIDPHVMYTYQNAPLEEREALFQRLQYRLLGVGYYVGNSVQGGHYVSAIRFPGMGEEWVLIDDGRMFPCPNPGATLITPEVTCLLFVRQ